MLFRAATCTIILSHFNLLTVSSYTPLSPSQDVISYIIYVILSHSTLPFVSLLISEHSLSSAMNSPHFDSTLFCLSPPLSPSYLSPSYLSPFLSLPSSPTLPLSPFYLSPSVSLPPCLPTSLFLYSASQCE
jgi:hypothetical protein